MDRLQRRQVRTRVLFIAVLLALCGGGVVARLFHLQVAARRGLADRASAQIRDRIEFLPKRGVISDREGRRLAVDVEVDSVYGVPSEIADKEAVARELAAVAGHDAAHYRSQLGRPASFVWLARRVSPAAAARIAERRWKGVGFLKETRRFYPQREFGAQVLGLAGIDNQGLAGIELSHDRDLWRDAVWVVAERDARGRDILLAGPPAEALREGDELRLTLDATIQFVAQEELVRGVNEAGAAGGSIVVMDPRTGDLLAMASLPVFNPNEPGSVRQEALRNRTVSDALEPGSVMKTFLLAGALEERAVTLGTPVFCENGSMPFAGGALRDVHRHGTLEVRDVFAKSSNIGSTKIAQRLGAEKLHRYLQAFGLGARTGIDLPGEAPGVLRPVDRWSGRSIAAVAIGQEISATPLQIATAFAAAVNGGTLLQPRVVRELRSPEGEVIRSFEPRVVRRVISAETSRRVVEALVHAVEDGTGAEAAIEGFTVGGKTGTAQKYDPRLRAYSRDRYLASFAGVAPAREPRLVVLVMIDEPEGTIYGGAVAAPVFRRVTQRVLRHLNLPPEDRERVLLVRSS